MRILILIFCYVSYSENEWFDIKRNDRKSTREKSFSHCHDQKLQSLINILQPQSKKKALLLFYFRAFLVVLFHFACWLDCFFFFFGSCFFLLFSPLPPPHPPPLSLSLLFLPVPCVRRQRYMVFKFTSTEQYLFSGSDISLVMKYCVDGGILPATE